MELTLIKKFILKVLLFLSPFILLGILFLTLDPFSMIHNKLKWAKSPLSINADYKVLNKFKRNNDSLNFNAFIFGNSKALGFISPHWKKHLNSDSRIFNFSSPGESVLNIKKKLQLIENSGNKIDFALLILDHNILLNTNNNHPFFEGPVYLKGPETSNNSKLVYLTKGFYYFLYDGWFINYFLKLNHPFKFKKQFDLNFISSKMTVEEFKYLEFSNEDYRWDVEVNAKIQAFDSIINQSVIDKNTNPIKISNEDLKHLHEIKQIFLKHNTNYKIIFGPYLNIPKTELCNLDPFKIIFENNKVFDFRYSKEIINRTEFYYDESHYRPLIGENILNSVYD